MTWKDITPFIAKFAPMLGTALAGPFGGAAGALIGQALGQEAPTPDSVSKALANQTMTPDQMVAIQKAENDFKIQMESMKIKSVQDLEVLAVDDRKSARDMQVSTKSSTPSILAYTVTVGFFGLLTCMLFHLMPSANADVLNTMVGALGAAFIGIINFFFGSSAGSEAKNKMLFNSTPKE